MKLIPLPAFQDNYLWLLHDGHHRALVPDPGGAEPLPAALQHHGLQQEAILVTPHNAPSVGIATERRIDPFLPSREPAVIEADRAFDARTTTDEAGVFATVRQWKNEFR